jgi:hypothetical protein
MVSDHNISNFDGKMSAGTAARQLIMMAKSDSLARIRAGE